jgi:hypothetical protein
MSLEGRLAHLGLFVGWLLDGHAVVEGGGVEVVLELGLVVFQEVSGLLKVRPIVGLKLEQGFQDLHELGGVASGGTE